MTGTAWLYSMLVMTGSGCTPCWLWLVLVVSHVGYDWYWLYPMLVMTGTGCTQCWWWLVLVISLLVMNFSGCIPAGYDWYWLYRMLVMTGTGCIPCWSPGLGGCGRSPSRRWSGSPCWWGPPYTPAARTLTSRKKVMRIYKLFKILNFFYVTPGINRRTFYNIFIIRNIL